MKKTILTLAAVMTLASCGNNQNLVIGEPVYIGEQTVVEVNEPATPDCPPYLVINNPEVDLSAFPVDKDGFHVLFNGNEKMQGWRGYGKDHIPSRWIVEDGCIKFCGTGLGEGQVLKAETLFSSTSSRTSSSSSSGRSPRAETLVSSILPRRQP